MTELEKALERAANLICETLCNLSRRINELDPEELKEMVDKMTAAEAKDINDGWVPVEERLPESENYILLSFANFSLPLVGRYEQDEDGGAFYIGDEDATCISQGVFVNAWMPLPEPYRPERREE